MTLQTRRQAQTHRDSLRGSAWSAGTDIKAIINWGIILSVPLMPLLFFGDESNYSTFKSFDSVFKCLLPVASTGISKLFRQSIPNAALGTARLGYLSSGQSLPFSLTFSDSIQTYGFHLNFVGFNIIGNGEAYLNNLRDAIRAASFQIGREVNVRSLMWFDTQADEYCAL